MPHDLLNRMGSHSSFQQVGTASFSQRVKSIFGNVCLIAQRTEISAEIVDESLVIPPLVLVYHQMFVPFSGNKNIRVLWIGHLPYFLKD